MEWQKLFLWLLLSILSLIRFFGIDFWNGKLNLTNWFCHYLIRGINADAELKYARRQKVASLLTEFLLNGLHSIQ